jgi:hypothetical protein
MAVARISYSRNAATTFPGKIEMRSSNVVISAQGARNKHSGLGQYNTGTAAYGADEPPSSSRQSTCGRSGVTPATLLTAFLTLGRTREIAPVGFWSPPSVVGCHGLLVAYFRSFVGAARRLWRCPYSGTSHISFPLVSRVFTVGKWS